MFENVVGEAGQAGRVSVDRRPQRGLEFVARSVDRPGSNHRAVIVVTLRTSFAEEESSDDDPPKAAVNVRSAEAHRGAVKGAQ
jgi:hypothetical protein